MNTINFCISSRKIEVHNSTKRIILDNTAECACCHCGNQFDYEYSITIDDENIYYEFYRSGQSQNYLKDVSNLRYDYYPPAKKCPRCEKYQPWMLGNIRNDYLLHVINNFVSAILFSSMVSGYLFNLVITDYKTQYLARIFSSTWSTIFIAISLLILVFRLTLIYRRWSPLEGRTIISVKPKDRKTLAGILYFAGWFIFGFIVSSIVAGLSTLLGWLFGNAASGLNTGLTIYLFLSILILTISLDDWYDYGEKYFQKANRIEQKIKGQLFPKEMVEKEEVEILSPNNISHYGYPFLGSIEKQKVFSEESDNYRSQDEESPLEQRGIINGREFSRRLLSLHTNISQQRQKWKETIKHPSTDPRLAAAGFKDKETIEHVTDHYTEYLVADLLIKTKCSSCGRDNSYTYQDIIKSHSESLSPMTLYTGVETGEPPAYIPKLGIFHSSEKEIAMKKTQKPFKCARCGIWNRWISKEMVLSQAKYGIKITGLAWSLGSIPVTIASFFLFPMNVEVVSALGKILLVTWVSWFLILGLVSLATYYSKDAQDIADTSEFIRFPKLRTFLIYILVNFGISILTASFLNGFSSSSNGMIPTIFTISTIVAFAFPFYLANKSNQSW